MIPNNRRTLSRRSVAVNRSGVRPSPRSSAAAPFWTTPSSSLAAALHSYNRIAAFRPPAPSSKRKRSPTNRPIGPRRRKSQRLTTYWKVLGVRPNATRNQVERAHANAGRATWNTHRVNELNRALKLAVRNQFLAGRR